MSEQKYQVTLKHGQTYVLARKGKPNEIFEYGEPRIVDAEIYTTLRQQAIKSIPLGDGGSEGRLDQNYFTFAKATVVPDAQLPPLTAEGGAVPLEDDFDLPTVKVSASAARAASRPKLEISEEAPVDLAPVTDGVVVHNEGESAVEGSRARVRTRVETPQA